MPSPADITEVRWTTKSARTASHERIVEIGIPTMDETCHRILMDEAVRLQRAGVKQFGVSVDGRMIGLKVETTPDGHRYLTERCIKK